MSEKKKNGRGARPTQPAPLVKSKDRVRDLAEVYTAEREVNAMLDLIPAEGWGSFTHPARFLEPACGNGNFLARILQRKLEAVIRGYKRVSRADRSQRGFEYYCLLAIASIYGIDICRQNVRECRARLLQIVKDAYSDRRNTWKPSEKYFAAVAHIIERNVVAGDTINGADRIVLTEWASPAPYKFKPRTFRLADLSRPNPSPLAEGALVGMQGLAHA